MGLPTEGIFKFRSKCEKGNKDMGFKGFWLFLLAFALASNTVFASGGSPAASFSALSFPAPATAVGASNAGNISVINSTSNPITIGSINITGANAADFSFTGAGASPCAAGSIIGRSGKTGNSCALTVTFRPLTAGANKSASLTVTFSTPEAGAITLPLTGTGLTPHPSLTPDGSVLHPASSDWGGTTQVGDTAVPLSFVMQNNGSGALSVNFSLSGDFVFAAANGGFSNCQQGTLLGPLGRCFIGVAFHPTAAGTRTGALTVSTNDPANPVVSFPLSGVGTAVVPPPPPPPTPIVSAFDVSDSWENTAETGWSISIIHHKNTTDALQAYWHTYDADGRDMWLKLTDGHWVDSTTFTGSLHRSTGSPFSSAYDPSALADTTVGAATLTFNDAFNGTLTYSVNGVGGTKVIARSIF
jgi:hypothetical protein